MLGSTCEAMSQHSTRSWPQHNFRLLWGGQTISQVGSQVTVWALPLTAVLLLHASPTQTGLLMAARIVPYLLAGLFAGAWVDRVRRRPVMITADIGRAVLLASIPVAAWFDVLSLTQLYVVAFGTGAFAILFDVAYVAFLPSVVAPEELLKSNSRLEASNAIAGIAGPGLAGILVQLLSGPIAILVDALSFVGSFGSLAVMRVHETRCASSSQDRRWSAPSLAGGVVITSACARQ
jgi:MFS family permease